MAHDAVHEHKTQAPPSIGCAIITCSDTRTPESDISGQVIRKLLEEQGHRAIMYEVVKDDPSLIQLQIALALVNPAVQAIIINGGTGVAKRDSTFESVDEMLEKRLEGFGQLFRVLSYQVAEEVRAGRLVMLLEEHEPASLPVHLIAPRERLAAAKARAFVDFALPRLKSAFAARSLDA